MRNSIILCQVNEKMCNLERDCIESRRDKIYLDHKAYHDAPSAI